MNYLDTSAFVKLVVAEPESSALHRALDIPSALVSSALLVVEAHRVGTRRGASEPAIDAALDVVSTVPADDAVLRRAATLRPAAVRSLDAIHLATAVSLGDDLDAFYCYDARLAAAAAELGLRVVAPA